MPSSNHAQLEVQGQAHSGLQKKKEDILKETEEGQAQVQRAQDRWVHAAVAKSEELESKKRRLEGAESQGEMDQSQAQPQGSGTSDQERQRGIEEARKDEQQAGVRMDDKPERGRQRGAEDEPDDPRLANTDGAQVVTVEVEPDKDEGGDDNEGSDAMLESVGKSKQSRWQLIEPIGAN